MCFLLNVFCLLVFLLICFHILGGEPILEDSFTQSRVFMSGSLHVFPNDSIPFLTHLSIFDFSGFFRLHAQLDILFLFSMMRWIPWLIMMLTFRRQ